MLTQEIFFLKKELAQTLFPAFLETKHQFRRRGWSLLKFSFKSKIFKENGQMVGDGEWRQQNFQLFIIANLFFYIEFQERLN